MKIISTTTFLLLPSFLIFGQTESITPDDYPVTNEMLRDNHSTRTIEDVVSLDKAWFKDPASKEVLVVELATDLHRYMIYHFNANSIPEHLIQKIELHTIVNNAYMMVGMNEKQATLAKFVDSANIINSSYFKTKKDFSLGTKKEIFIKTYDKPDKCFNSNTFEICIWRFNGDQQNSGSNIERPLVKNSFGYEVTAYFKEDKLIAMIIFNDIP